MSSGRVVVNLIESIKCLRHLFTKIRDSKTERIEFTSYASRLMRVICEEGLAYIQPVSKVVQTPTNSTYDGIEIDQKSIVAVSIIRAGDSMLDSFMSVAPEAAVGKILIQRDEETAKPILFYSKLPSLEGKNIALLDPMLATGGSAIAAIKVLIEKGAEERRIVFFNVVSCPEGIKSIHSEYPNVTIVTGEVDAGLNEKRYIVPGLGDYGDRYYGTI